jgi:thiamine biosynthesis protein ThiI
MVRFGELSTKGKNKKDFIRVLSNNIRHALKDIKEVRVETRYDHIYVHLNGVPYETVIDILKDVSGIYSLSLVYRAENDIDKIVEASFNLIKQEKGETFKVKAKRGNKRFPIVSDTITRMVASKILRNLPLKVDVHNPDILLSIEVRDEGTYIFFKTFKGAGGYPLGVGGKGMLMLSGGIDSPVAAYLLMKRGVFVECIHFASPPYTSQAVIIKLKDLLSKLNRFQATIRLHIVPFTKLQEAIYANVDESYAITIMRRMMFRLADRLAKRRHCPIIVTGESLGQVASQTIYSMNVINEVSNMPVIRPCVTLDKTEIIDYSKRIGTYEISIRPYEDCCTIFAPKNPKTMPKLEECLAYEKKFDYEALIEEALSNFEVMLINSESLNESDELL